MGEEWAPPGLIEGWQLSITRPKIWTGEESSLGKQSTADDVKSLAYFHECFNSWVGRRYYGGGYRLWYVKRVRPSMVGDSREMFVTCGVLDRGLITWKTTLPRREIWKLADEILLVSRGIIIGQS